VLTAAELLQELLKRARVPSETEIVGLADACMRVLAKGMTSLTSVPPLDNSAMDGYAVRAAEVRAGEPMWVSQRITTGRVGEFLQPGTCARIFTGAPIPPGADAVIMQENAIVEGEEIRFPVLPKIGQHIRRAGEDILTGAEVLPPGARLKAAEIGLAASAGLNALAVYRRLKVAIFSTGDELAEPGEALKPGQISTPTATP